MREWLRNKRADFRQKTASMDGRQKAEYILTYYWYHILLLLVVAGLFFLLVRHLFFREPPKEWTCVLVNQRVDYERDERLAADFAQSCGLRAEQILVDSDYVFSYDEVKLEAANESSYEKFFFQWYNGEMDAVLMPESFYQHCKKLEYDFADLGQMLGREQQEKWDGQLLGGTKKEALYIEGTRLASYVEQSQGEQIVLVFLPNGKHRETAAAFWEFALGE